MHLSQALCLLICFASLPFSIQAATTAGGTLTSNTTWSVENSPINVYSNVIVPNGLTLTITTGTVVRLTNGISISVQAGGKLDVYGTGESNVVFQPMNGNNAWGSLNGSGNNSTINLRHAELARGRVLLNNQATGLLEDTYIHDIGSAIEANGARLVTMRRIWVRNYSETIFNSGTTVLAEDSLFENLTAGSSDAFEIQGGQPGSIIRRCTFRNATGANSDAFDCNGTRGAIIHDCLIYNFTDKAVSFGAAGAGGQADYGMVVSNCLIYGANIGIALKDGSTASAYNNTIVDCVYGFRFNQKFQDGGGNMTNSYNNILWGNDTNVFITEGGTLVATHSLIGGGWPGTGNIDTDPLFANEGLRDYRLGNSSPARGAGYNGVDMGALFPVGAQRSLSHPAFTGILHRGGDLVFQFWQDSGKTYSLQQRGPSWQTISNFAAGTSPQFRNVTTTPGLNTNLIFRLITPQQP